VTGEHRRVFRVGLTGGIASGKSTVAKLFAALGVPVIDADELAREVVAPGTELLARLVERFGPAVLAADRALNRRALREVVFADLAARADLEALTHPAIRAAMEERSRAAGGPYQIFMIPLLLETGDREGFDRVLVVDCDPELQVRRLQARDGSTLEQVRAILGAQASRAVRLKEADDLITNDGELHALTSQVERIHLQYLRMAAAQATP
jgi:dephospho-CoA kinase